MKKNHKTTEVKRFLNFLNKEYFLLHKKYEDLFWLSYMGDHSVDIRKDRALAARDTFRANPKHLQKIYELIPGTPKSLRTRLELWREFFSRYQTPREALPIKQKIDALESVIHKKRATRKEGYVDPKSKKFVEASYLKMRTTTATNPDERLRKACFDACEELAKSCLAEYVELIALRNQYARTLGYEDFYDFKLQREDGMTKRELFSIFDTIYEQTKYAKDNVKKLEKDMPGLRKPWNFSYMMAGDFTKEEDPFFPFEEALMRWGRSFAALGIDFKGGTLTLDLLDRKGKYNNGFCHWPDLVRFENGNRVAGSTNFTCNVVFGQVGSAQSGYTTLFHEGGHAAHLLNVEMQDVCVNHEYAPMSTAWAETQSMFLDTMFSSSEWEHRYAKNIDGMSYPADLRERMIRKLHVLRPTGLWGIMFVSSFEKEIYEMKDLTTEKVLNLARTNYKKYYVLSEDSLGVLNVPHIYAWESSASYHGYGLAELALMQWREYFYNKYGYIVDNKYIGKEMSHVWKLGGSKTFSEFVVMATGKKLSAQAYVKNATFSIPATLKLQKSRIARMDKIKIPSGPIKLNARVNMVHGKKKIADNSISFEDMVRKYGMWLKSQK